MSEDKQAENQHPYENWKVHVVSTIICNGKTYHIECNVKWDEKLKQHKVKNAQIVPVGDHVTV